MAFVVEDDVMSVLRVEVENTDSFLLIIVHTHLSPADLVGQAGIDRYPE